MYSMDSDDQSLDDMHKLLKILLKDFNRICYITLNKSGESVKEFCKENDIDFKKIVVVDMISSRFRKCQSEDSIFYSDLIDLEQNFKEVINLIEKEKCDALILDSLSTMQIYYSESEILKFVHKLLVYTQGPHIIVNLIIYKEDVKREWVKVILPMVGKIKEIKFDR